MNLITRIEAALAFDYASLPPALVEAQKARDDRIATLKRRTVETMGEIGRELLAAQEELERGTFLRWVEDATGLSKSTAYRFMDMARAFGSELPTVGSLPPALVQTLAAPSTPEPIRAAVLKRMNAGETVKAETILDEVREAREEARATAKAEKETARRAALTDEQRAEEDALRAKGEKGRLARERKLERERQERRERDRQEQAEIAIGAAFLVERIGADDLVAFLARYSSSQYKVLEVAHRLAQVERAQREAPTEVPAHRVSRTGELSDFYAPPEAKAEAVALAERIQDGETPDPIIVEADPHRRGYFDVMAGHATFRALTDVLGQATVPVRIAPPITSNALEKRA